MLEKTVKVDSTSLIGLIEKFTRVGMEIDLSTPLLPSLSFFDFAYAVEYKGLHLICFGFGCGKYRHKVEECLALNEGTTNSSVPLDSQQSLKIVLKLDPNPSKYDPWMLPSYVSQRALTKHPTHQCHHHPSKHYKQDENTLVDRTPPKRKFGPR